MSALSPAIYESIEISAETTNGSKKTIELNLGVIKINIFEDLFSPTITAQVLVVSSGGAVPTTNKEGESEPDTMDSVYSGLPIRGGERVSIKIANNTDNNLPIAFNTPDTYLYVSNVSRQFSDGAKELFTLELVSREAITNETSRCVKRYSKTASISQHVKDIIEEKLASTIPDENIDTTVNEYGFVGNLKKPFNILVWLAAKAKPERGTLPGYFFYQTREGFKFKAIDRLIEDGKKNPKATYEEIRFKENSQLGTDANDFTILSYNVIQNNDLLKKLAYGQYSSHIMEFDPLTGYFTTEEQGRFTLDDTTRQDITFPEIEKNDNVVKTEDVVTLGATPEIPVLLSDDTTQNLGTLPSRLITMVADRGTLEFDPNVDKNSNPTRWQRQAYLRYQLLFTQVLQMVVPLNTNLVAGDVINVKFLKADLESKEHDRKQSGNYLIKELCHHFDANMSLTSLKLVRDTFGEISK